MSSKVGVVWMKLVVASLSAACAGNPSRQTAGAVSFGDRHYRARRCAGDTPEGGQSRVERVVLGSAIGLELSPRMDRVHDEQQMRRIGL